MSIDNASRRPSKNSLLGRKPSSSINSMLDHQPEERPYNSMKVEAHLSNARSRSSKVLSRSKRASRAIATVRMSVATAQGCPLVTFYGKSVDIRFAPHYLIQSENSAQGIIDAPHCFAVKPRH